MKSAAVDPFLRGHRLVLDVHPVSDLGLGLVGGRGVDDSARRREPVITSVATISRGSPRRVNVPSGPLIVAKGIDVQEEFKPPVGPQSVGVHKTEAIDPENLGTPRRSASRRARPAGRA